MEASGERLVLGLEGVRSEGGEWGGAGMGLGRSEEWKKRVGRGRLGVGPECRMKESSGGG